MLSYLLVGFCFDMFVIYLALTTWVSLTCDCLVCDGSALLVGLCLVGLHVFYVCFDCYGFWLVTCFACDFRFRFGLIVLELGFGPGCLDFVLGFLILLLAFAAFVGLICVLCIDCVSFVWRLIVGGFWGCYLLFALLTIDCLFWGFGLRLLYLCFDFHAFTVCVLVVRVYVCVGMYGMGFLVFWLLSC